MDTNGDPPSVEVSLTKVVVWVIVAAIAMASLWFYDTFRDHCDSRGDAVLEKLETDPMSTLDIPGTTNERHSSQRQCQDWFGTNRGPETFSSYVVEDASSLKSVVDLTSAAASLSGWVDIETEWWATLDNTGSLRAHRSLVVDSIDWEAELLVTWGEYRSDTGHHLVTITVRAHEPYRNLTPQPTPRQLPGRARLGV